jgi:SAM-dependent methyltransferase
MNRFYSSTFYENQQDGSRSSAQLVLPIIFDLVNPKSIVDVGCGVGTWLAVAKTLGATSLVGYEGEWIRNVKLAAPGLDVRAADLEMPLKFNKKVDLVMCMEVAEHLSSARSGSLVGDLCSASDFVLFGAAIPGQGGANHINEQWQSYWASIFDKNHFAMLDIIRPALWRNRSVEFWYRQNTFLYVNRSRLNELDIRTGPTPIIDIGHPDLVEAKSRERSIGMIFAELRAAIFAPMVNSLKARLLR